MAEETQHVRSGPEPQTVLPPGPEAVLDPSDEVETHVELGLPPNPAKRVSSDAASILRSADASTRARLVRRLQRERGNAYVQRVVAAVRSAPGVQRDDASAQPVAPAAAATTLPSAEDLTTRLDRCIGIWETNRGGDQPAPRESSLDTAAGVKASMATIEQATMPYAITALKGSKALRDKASPPLTMKELNDAEARCTAVSTLLTLVAGAAGKGTTPDDFIKDNGDAITATGLSNEDVKTMFSAATLKSTIDTLHGEVADKKKSVDEAVKSIPSGSRVGIGETSLSAYIKDPKKWGENTAAWRRKAVEAMPGDVGTRIETVATSDSGTALASAVIRTRVDTQLAKQPVPSEDEIVKAVAQQNNPGETNYGENVWKIYQRLYPGQAAAKK